MVYTMYVGKLVRVFASWREYTSGCVARRIVNERALVHSHHHLVWSCFVAWYKYHQLAQRKMVSLVLNTVSVSV